MENRVTKLHERVLIIVHSDQSHLIFEQLLTKETILSAHRKKIANTYNENWKMLHQSLPVIFFSLRKKEKR